MVPVCEGQSLGVLALGSLVRLGGKAEKVKPQRVGVCMAYTNRSEAREYECPVCEAGVGKKCLGSRGKQRMSVHLERLQLASSQLGHSPVVGVRIADGVISDATGLVLGRVHNVTIEVDAQGAEGIGENLRRGVGEEREQKFPQTEGPTLSQGSAEGATQTSMVEDPVEEVWSHYAVALERPKAVLTPKVRRWLNAAIQEVGVERCTRAIDGLAASEYHRQNGYVGIEYALVPKQGQTIDSRVSMMEGRAPTGPNGQTRVQALVARLPSEVHGMVHGWIADVEAHLRNPNHRGLAATAEGRLRDLAQRAHMEPEVVDGRIVGWRDLR